MYNNITYMNIVLTFDMVTIGDIVAKHATIDYDDIGMYEIQNINDKVVPYNEFFDYFVYTSSVEHVQKTKVNDLCICISDWNNFYKLFNTYFIEICVF